MQYDQAGHVSSASAADNCIDLNEYGDDYDNDGNEDICVDFEEDLNDRVQNGVEDNQVNDVKEETGTNKDAFNGRSNH